MAKTLAQEKLGGVVLRSIKKNNGDVKISVSDKPQHYIVVGTTGSGKTQSIVGPTILSIGNADASLIINDPKAEIYSKYSGYLKRKGYKVYAMNYLNTMAGSCFNQCYSIVNEYEKGLPHFYSAKAIDSIIKSLDLITSQGEIDNLMVWTLQEYSNAEKPYDAELWEVKGRFNRTGISKNDKTTTLIPRKRDDIKISDDLFNFLTKSPDTLIDYLIDTYLQVFNSIQKDYDSEKTSSVDACAYNNEYLKVRQEAVCQAAVDTLRTITPDNMKMYYSKKLESNTEILNRADKDTSAYAMTKELVNKYETILGRLSEDSFEFDDIKEFLKDLKADHEAVWKHCETNALNDAGSIATILIGDDSNSGDKFWSQSATALVRGLIMMVCRESHLDNSKHLGSVYAMLSSLTVPDNQGHTDLDRITDRFLDSDLAKMAQATTRIASEKTKTSVFASAITPMSIFLNDSIVDQSSRCDFDLTQVAREKTAIFLISPGSDDTGAAQNVVLSTLFIEELYNALNNALMQTKDQTLPLPVYFILDELSNLKKIPNLDGKITLARSKNMRFVCIFQSLTQLATKYKVEADTIKENSNLIYLLSNSTGTAKEISERIGKETVEINSYSSSDNKNGSSTSTNTSSIGKDLITPQELMQMKEGDAVVLLTRQPPYKTHLEMNYKWPIYEWLENNKIINPHQERNQQEVARWVPDVNNYTFAYESLYRDTILDKFIWEHFRGLN